MLKAEKFINIEGVVELVKTPTLRLGAMAIISTSLSACSAFVERYPQQEEALKCVGGNLAPFLVLAGLAGAVYLMTRE